MIENQTSDQKKMVSTHHPHAHMFVKLNIVPLKVTERDERNQVVGDRKPGMSDPPGPFEMLPGVHECNCANARR